MTKINYRYGCTQGLHLVVDASCRNCNSKTLKLLPLHNEITNSTSIKSATSTGITSLPTRTLIFVPQSTCNEFVTSVNCSISVCNVSKTVMKYRERESNLKAQLLKSCWTSRFGNQSSAGTKHKTLLQRKQLTPINANDINHNRNTSMCHGLAIGILQFLHIQVQMQ